jgi:hypothetical protein
MTTTKEAYAMFNEMGTQGYESAQQLGEINLRSMETLVARQMDAMNLFMETGLRQVQLATESKGYNDLIKGEIALAKELTERLMAESRDNVKLANTARDEYRAWFEQAAKTVGDKVGKVQATV